MKLKQHLSYFVEYSVLYFCLIYSIILIFLPLGPLLFDGFKISFELDFSLEAKLFVRILQSRLSKDIGVQLFKSAVVPLFFEN